MDDDMAPAAYRIAALRLSNFRNYASLSLDPQARSVALVGANGAGKTNLLEAISLLTPGRGLRGAAFDELARETGSARWAVFARIAGPAGLREVGTGQPAGPEQSRRDVRIDGDASVSVNDLADVCRMVWLTPAMDGLFTGPAADRRRFLDRLVLALDAGHRRRVNAFEAAMRQRNALLEQARPDTSWLDAIEAQMAEHGAAVAAARRDTVGLLQGVLATRAADDPFPGARLALEGELEADLAVLAAVDAEDRYRERLAAARGADAAAGRTSGGPHRSDLVAYHAVKQREARLCSTGEQKILLIGLILAHARLVAAHEDGAAPLILLDEVAAHLDARHRGALFGELLALGAQAWMTGTDEAMFADAGVQIYRVHDGCAVPL